MIDRGACSPGPLTRRHPAPAPGNQGWPGIEGSGTFRLSERCRPSSFTSQLSAGRNEDTSSFSPSLALPGPRFWFKTIEDESKRESAAYKREEDDGV